MWIDVAIEQNRRQCDNSEGVVDSISEKNDIDTRSKRVSLGFSSLQELIFLVALRTSSKGSRKLSSASGSDSCVCGLPLGR
jgi:hypothetical protein